jgi:hypothetical protein
MQHFIENRIDYLQILLGQDIETAFDEILEAQSIARSMRNKELFYCVYHYIQQEHHSAASQMIQYTLGSNMLTKTHSFITDFDSWVDSFYSTLLQSSGSTKELI